MMSDRGKDKFSKNSMTFSFSLTENKQTKEPMKKPLCHYILKCLIFHKGINFLPSRENCQYHAGLL